MHTLTVCFELLPILCTAWIIVVISRYVPLHNTPSVNSKVIQGQRLTSWQTNTNHSWGFYACYTQLVFLTWSVIPHEAYDLYCRAANEKLLQFRKSSVVISEASYPHMVLNVSKGTGFISAHHRKQVHDTSYNRKQHFTPDVKLQI